VIRLVRADADLLDAAIAGDDALARALGHPVAPGWASFREALAPQRDLLAADPERAAWGTRLFVTEEPPELVGWGGFKGPPADGVVELGYEIADDRRGRGLATAAVYAMLGEAFADARVSEVVASTLAERGPSTRVLEKAGFRFAGDDHEDGVATWRHSLARPASVDTVRDGIAAFNRRDFDAALGPARDDVTWEPFLSRLDTPLLLGKDEIRTAWESQVQALDLRVEPDALIPVGDRTVVVPARSLGRGSGSDVPVSASVVFVWEADDDGRFARVRTFESLDQALAAAGAGAG
jgi:RimJ/RimL family protein N-acetyltransferase/ketosteroid isomerase-like protein